MMRKFALFGGTFDPIHEGHLFIARCAREHLSLERVIFIPCYESPHKEGMQSAPAEDRLAMTELATAKLSWASVSPWEIQRKERSFSWQTAAHFRQQWPADEVALYWIIGMDQWEAIERWSRIDYLSQLITFIVFPRNGGAPREKPGIPAVFLSEEMDISASGIRSRLERGRPVDGVDPAVKAYIQRSGLYRAI